MTSNKKITMRQLQILIILSAMGTGVIVLPRRAADFLPEGAQDGWIIALGLMLIALVAGALIGYAAQTAQKAAEFAEKANESSPSKKTEMSFISAMGVLLTKPVAYAIGAILWLKLIVAAGLELRIFLEISQEIMLPNTPIPVVSAVMIAACAYAAALGFEARARVGEVLISLLILPFLFVFAIAVFDADFSNLQPVLANDVHSIIRGSVRLGFILTGLECLLLVAPFVPGEKSLARAIAGAIFVAGVVIVGITAITIAAFGRGVLAEPWPVLSMMDVVSLPGAFIERQEALMFGFWIITAFALGNAMLFFGGLLVGDIVKKANLRIGVIVSAVGVFAVSILPLHREEIYARIDLLYMATGIFFLFVLPIVLLIAAKITMHGQKRSVAPAIFLLLALILFTSCWDRAEIENRAFVVSMGADRAEDNYAITLSIPVMNGDDNEADAHTNTEKGKTVTEALKKLDAKNDKQLYFGQTKLLVLGEDLLSCSHSLRGALLTLGNKVDSSRRIHVVAAEAPEKIIRAQPPGEVFPGTYVSDIYRDKNKIGGRAFALDFERLLHLADENLNPGGDAIIPKIHPSEDELRLSGAYVLKNVRKAGSLSPGELQGLLWAFPDACKGAIVTTNDISLKVDRHKTKIFFEPCAPLRAVIEVSVTGTVDEVSQIAMESQEVCDALADIFAAEIEEQILATAKILQNEFHVDGYNFLEHLRKKNYPLYKEYADNWQEVFSQMAIVPVVAVKI